MHNPILLAVKLSNRHFMTCKLFHPDQYTLSYLNRWHTPLHKAIFLVELGNLHSVVGPKASAMYRDLGEHRMDHQVKFARTHQELRSLARSSKITTLYCYENNHWQVHKNSTVRSYLNR
ncbi:hypothetical protein [Endozoicomonas sp. Mp262]|uniref:hypothetical protein n=1 Tax=Endozoicomonas sp. Mp262 TaxID=2919499 RepID=UPI0021E0D7D4